MAIKINLDKELLAKAEKHAASSGYPSIQEFIVHLIEKELSSLGQENECYVDSMKKRLQGLGYLD